MVCEKFKDKGKIFRWVGARNKKADAKKTADYMRSKGLLARVKFCNNRWVIYSGGKRKC